MALRYPAVADQFYPGEPTSLRESIEECFLHRLGPGKKPPSTGDLGKVIGLVSPHAGYMYSGPVAAHGYYAISFLKNVRLIVIIGPNHWGLGSGVAVYPSGAWITPLGRVEVDKDAAEQLLKSSDIVDFDELAHRNEHSIEVQIPFLQYTFPKGFKILPICMALQDKLTSVEVGEALADVIKGKDALLIASSDFTHYESQESAFKKDSEAIKAICDLDVDRFYTVIRKMDISTCGHGPIAVLMTVAKKLNVAKGTLLKYATSGDITGDFSAVVGYASIIL
ncbi:MAG: MEMO1 family protein [Nitrososphaerota archaeon]|nr:MEMO1 family protein [Nitrososphaerales archaeon]MDW8045233.1 MEMO1 family protein [Nitrososphaerota archaeon]